MVISEIIDKVKGFFNKGNNIDNDAPRELRDRHLESLEREWQYYENQKRKEMLIKRLKELKHKQIRERLCGSKNIKHPSILKAKLYDSGVDLCKEKFQLLKQKRRF